MAGQITIAIEGNIAAGKSTLLESLRLSSFAQVIVEPVDRWQEVIPGQPSNIMERMYSDPKRWAYLFQNYVLLTMMEAHDTPQTKPLRVLERSVYSARYCFVENLRKINPPLIDDMEFAVYQRWFDWLMEHNKPKVDLIVYLRSSPEVCLERLKTRGRKEEAGVQLSYLQTLHERYEDWLYHMTTDPHFGVPILILDANQDFATYKNLHEDFCGAINASISQCSGSSGQFTPPSHHLVVPAKHAIHHAIPAAHRRLFPDEETTVVA
eukprot:m.330061 g.330061  ORF g.330061 m.330061 type:complete len:266 (-) comp55605_c0_seq4:373-1170(-)